MPVNFLLTVNAGPSNAVDDGSHPSFRRLCRLLDGHGIPATWVLDDKLMANAVAGFAGQQGPDATDMESAIKSMATPQEMAFVDFAIGAEKDRRPTWKYLEFDLPGSTQRLSHSLLRYFPTGFAQVIKFRRGLRRAIQTEADFHLILDPGFLKSTRRSCGFLENILFDVTEHQADGRIKFATIKDIRLKTGNSAPDLRETAA
ncbi:MAG: hypothetical protein HQ514_10680 [Rhodospirillales bacterium]|nr:hypothetical protein [Rhodospirillales bacterium]